MKQVIFLGGYTSLGNFGIHRISIDTCTGTLEPMVAVPDIDNPIYFAITKDGSRLYVAQGSTLGAPRASNGSVAVYAVDENFGLKLLDRRDTPDSIPCFIALDRNETAITYAEYACAHAGVIGLKPDGTFAEDVFTHHSGHGPNEKRQEAAHAHCAVTTPDNRILCVCDLGIDTVVAYDFTDLRHGLKRLPDSDIHVMPGFGPRHLIFSANGQRAYLVNELASKVQSFAFDGKHFELLQTLSMLPKDCSVETKAAAIRLSPDGRWLLASNRGHDSIAAFRVDDDGMLSEPVISKLTGSFPRDFAFVPGSDFVICGHKLSDELAIYRFNSITGALSRQPATYAMERPLAIAFARMNH